VISGAVTTRRLDAAGDLPAALQRLAAELESLPDDGTGVHRVEVPLGQRAAALDLPAGAPAGVLEPRMLLGPTWSGLGTAFEADLASLDHLAAPPPPLRLAFSLRFDPSREVALEWHDVGRCRAWLPALELDADDQVVALNWRAGNDRAALHAALSSWRQPVSTSPPPLAVAWQADDGARLAWRSAVDAALCRIADTDALPLLRKIVLARRLDGVLDHAADPAGLLRAAPLGSVGWPWWLERGGRSWLGETPELLGARDGATLRTEALAGTRPRHGDPAQDQALADDLLASDKDRREQAAVADWLRGQLARLAGRDPAVGALSLRRLPSLQHLCRELEVTADDSLADAAWLQALHPTPALCGAPRAEVRAWLREAEPFDRGLYGGVLGWLERDRAEARVAIRGLLLHDRQVSVYAGAGLVRGSDPDREWAETQAKAAAVCRRLGLSLPEVTA
jgi:menaquinone-specific isochorismate synthase